MHELHAEKKASIIFFLVVLFLSILLLYLHQGLKNVFTSNINTFMVL